MAINGSPSMSQVAAEFGGSAPHALNEYYGVRFSTGTYAPSSGAISLSYFRNRSKYVGPPYVAPPPYICFSFSSPVQLQSGEVVRMEDLKLGDFLSSGAQINVLLNINNISQTKFMKIFSETLDEYIYVTGSHLVRENDIFIPVSDYSKSEMTDIKPDNFICLITDDNTIPIGEHIFWDWLDKCDACNATICK